MPVEIPVFRSTRRTCASFCASATSRYDPAMPSRGTDLTLLIDGARRGEGDASARLFELVYAELRGLAGAYGREQDAGWTLQPTAVVHEAWLKIAGAQSVAVRDRAHFFAVAATAMRQVLVDHARARGAQKRGGAAARVTLDEAVGGGLRAEVDAVALADALEQLAAFDARKHRVVELRYFGGLSVEEVAGVLDVGKTTVESEWRAARAWLASRLDGA